MLSYSSILGIDTDKHKYPIGSGRVTFNCNRSYMKAVSSAFIEIKTAKFTKKVQVDPYLEDSLCSACGVQHGPYYCRELSCFRYILCSNKCSRNFSFDFPWLVLTNTLVLNIFYFYLDTSVAHAGNGSIHLIRLIVITSH